MRAPVLLATLRADAAVGALLCSAPRAGPADDAHPPDGHVPGNSKMRNNLMALGLCAALSLLSTACDDGDSADSPDAAGQGGAGGQGGDGGAGGDLPEPVEGFVVTELRITDPPPPAGGLLKNLLNASINDERVIIIFRFGEVAGARKIYAGAAQYALGQGTPSLEDDVFEWLTGGICGDAMGVEAPCTAGLSEANVTFTGDDFVSDPTFLDIYSEDLKAIIHIKDANISGTLSESGTLATASLQGVITQEDARNTPFELVPDSGDYTDLDTVFTQFNVMPDATSVNAQGETVPAYRLEGSLDAALIQFQPAE